MSKERVFITEPDLLTLANILEAESRWPSADRRDVRALRSKLAEAEIVPDHRVPADVITLLSRVHVKDVQTGSETTCLLVVPPHASTAEARISVLSSLGAVLLGSRQGDVVDHRVQGERRSSRIERVLYQPEAQRGRALHDGEHGQASVPQAPEAGGPSPWTRAA
jgi:regulator of nucleoside diphosphate kinase